MTREEAITYGERKRARIQEKLCRDESSYGDHSIYYSEMEFTSAALSALREQEERRWIPVTERLPDKPMKCLVYTKRGYCGGYDISYYNQGFYLQYANVTHWMPLPEPPKGE